MSHDYMLQAYFEGAVRALLPRKAKDAPVSEQELQRFATVFDFKANAQLAIPNDRGKSALSDLDIDATCQKIMQKSHAALVSAFLKALCVMYRDSPASTSQSQPPKPNLIAAHGMLKRLSGLFVEQFSDLIELPVSRGITSTLSLYNEAACAQTRLQANAEDSLNSPVAECIMLLSKVFGLSVLSRTDPLQNKRRCVVPVASLLLQNYLGDGKFFFCEKLLREMSTAIDLAKDLADFPKKDAVKMSYYVGKLATIRGRYQEAQQHLTFAFLNCHRDNAGNARRILRLLVPVKMLLGEVPNEKFLTSNGLQLLVPLVTAVREGQLGAFRRFLEKHQNVLARWDVLLTLERLEVIVFRNLVRIVKTMLHTHRIPLPDIEVAMRLSGCEPRECEPGQAACHLANVIELGLIRGNISHEHQILVVSEVLAFPEAQKILVKIHP